MISAKEISQCRSPRKLREFVAGKFTVARDNKTERHLGMQKKGEYKEFFDEIVPLSQFAAQMYPETYLIKPILGNQGYDAIVFDEVGTEVDKIEVTNPHDGAATAVDARLAVSRGFGRSQPNDPGDDFNALIPFIVSACRSKSQKDYGGCTLLIAINPFPPISGYECGFEAQVKSIVDELKKFQFKAKKVFLLVLPDRIEEIQ